MATHVCNYRKFSLWSEILGKLFTVVSRWLSDGFFSLHTWEIQGESCHFRAKTHQTSELRTFGIDGNS